MSESLAQAIARVGNPVDVVRNQSWPAYTFPVAPEFSNWRDEQRAWDTTVALLDQSQHMSLLFLTGDDVIPMLASISPNTFANFRAGIAKQLIGVNENGFLIGDDILFHLGDDGLVLVGNIMLMDWVRYNAELAQARGEDVHHRLEGNATIRQGPPTFYRYELQGPNALKLTEKLIGAPVPDVKFFHIADFTIAGKPVKALRHGMVGQPGFEFFGPWKDAETIRSAMLDAGAEFGILPAGSRAYSGTSLPSGWVPTPFPAIYDDDMAEYREWLPLGRASSVGGSLYSSDVRDFYFTPYDLGLGRSVKFDHDFHGRAALERHAANQRRRKVTLIWNAADVAGVLQSQLEPGLPAKFIEFPKARYGYFQADEVLRDDKRVGVSTDAGYVAFDQLFLSLASVDIDLSDGTEVEVVWGEDPISKKPQVEPHRQVRIRATVAPAPYHEYARTVYRSNR